MKKIQIKADLSIVSESHQILIQSDVHTVLVSIEGKSAFYIPFKQLKKIYSLKSKSNFIKQAIIIRHNENLLCKLYKGKLDIHSYSNVIKILLKSVFLNT